MSKKAQGFANFLGNPLNTHNYEIIISSFPNCALLVNNTTFPQKKFNQYTLTYEGENVGWPSIPITGGTWTITMPEGELKKVFEEVEKFRNKIHNDLSGVTLYNAGVKFDIDIYARSLSSQPLLKTKLTGCYLIGLSPVNLANNAPTTNWIWSLEFHYDDIDNSNQPTTSAVQVKANKGYNSTTINKTPEGEEIPSGL